LNHVESIEAAPVQIHVIQFRISSDAKL
jgi:hypothetical protein